MVTISLSEDEALVLSALFASLPADATILDLINSVDRQVIWNLECVLEERLVEPLRDDYDERLEHARERIRASINE